MAGLLTVSYCYLLVRLTRVEQVEAELAAKVLPFVPNEAVVVPLAPRRPAFVIVEATS